ncbi:MAG: HAMP domain-containing protein [Thermicanus sp.]|nr:HAMP domain-containing protein [Thermicanus sp.]
MQLTLKGKLILWNAILIGFVGVFLLISFNSFTSYMLPKVMIEEQHQLSPEKDASSSSARKVQIEPIPHPFFQKMDISTTRGIRSLTDQLRLFSLICLFAAILFGSAGVYFLTTRALKPVQVLSNRMKQINIHQLTTPIPMEGAEDEIREMARSFNDMLERLNRVFQRQQSFISNAAHELRTPLSILQTNLEMITRDPNATLEEHKEMLHVFRRNLQRLDELIKHLLLLASEKPIPLEDEINLHSTLKEVLHELMGIAKKNSISIQVNGDPHLVLRGNQVLLRRALSNLIENGILYNRPHGKVEVSYFRRSHEIVIMVTDTGPGIPKEALPHIFEPFYRMDDARSKNKTGSGLGLTIASSILSKHGGSIRVERMEPGTRFILTLPQRSSSINA